MKKILSFTLVASVLLASAIFGASDASNYVPVLKFRTDLKCWPSYTNDGNDSGECRSESDFVADPPPVFYEEYTEVINDVTVKLITYWIYYSNQSDCCSFGGSHDDDWERVTVHLYDGELHHVTYNQHNGRYTLDAIDVPLSDDTHPIIYVGKYAHGNYHDQRSKCTWDSACYLDGNYCYYWKDPRGPGETWQPSNLLPLTDLSADIEFSGSTNPRNRTRPEYDTVCRSDGGNDIAFGIGIEDTCDRNPGYLNDETTTLLDMAQKYARLSVSFLSHHDTYFVSEGNGGDTVNADRTAIGTYEKFTMIGTNSNAGCIVNGDCIFRAKPATDSVLNLPPVPGETCQ